MLDVHVVADETKLQEAADHKTKKHESLIASLEAKQHIAKFNPISIGPRIPTIDIDKIYI